MLIANNMEIEEAIYEGEKVRRQYCLIDWLR